MNNFFDLLDKFKYGIIAAIVSYLLIFMYLQLGSYEETWLIDPFHDGARIEIPEEDVHLKPENIQLPPDFNAGELKSISRDMNDDRKKAMDKWSQNKSLSDVEQSVKDFEKKAFEQSGGEAERKRIQQEMDDRKNKKDNSNNKPKDNSNATGGNTSFAGNVMVDWSLQGRTAHQNNNWYVRNPGYTCGVGSSGRIVIAIRVNNNGDVMTAVPTSVGSANSCMIEQAIKYAKMSRFNFSSGAEKNQEGTIIYTFVSQ